jgi:SAM-dependent methyltransferase
MSTGDSPWEAYYRAIQGRAARPLFRAARAAFAGPPPAAAQAIDYGCGDGTEALALLADGWRVLAIDRQPEAIARLLAAAPPAQRPQLTTQVAAFQDAALPPADFIYAGLSLPFCEPAHFPAVWRGIAAALRGGGRFAGHLFGPRDGWSDRPEMTFLARGAILQLLSGFTIELLAEHEEDRPTALGEHKHWHIFELIARRPA